MRQLKQYLNRAEAARYLGIEPSKLDQYTTYWKMKYYRQIKRKLFTKTELRQFLNLPGNHVEVEYDPFSLIRPKKNSIVIELYPDGITALEQPLKSTVR